MNFVHSFTHAAHVCEAPTCNLINETGSALLRLTKDNCFLGEESKPQMELMRFVDNPIVLTLKVFDDLHLQNLLLFDEVKIGEFLHHFPMWPAILIDAFQFII